MLNIRSSSTAQLESNNDTFTALFIQGIALIVTVLQIVHVPNLKVIIHTNL